MLQRGDNGLLAIKEDKAQGHLALLRDIVRNLSIIYFCNGGRENGLLIHRFIVELILEI